MTEKSAGDVSLGLEVGKGFAAKLIQAVLGFTGMIIFARVLGPTDFGGFYLLMSLLGIVKRPISGVTNAVQKRFAETDSPRGELIGLQAAFNVTFIVVVTTAASVFHRSLQTYTGLSDGLVFFIILSISLFMFSSFQSLISSIGRVGLQTWIDTARSVLTLGLQLGLVALGWGVSGMVFGLFGATVLVMPLTYYSIRVLPELPSMETVASVWSFAKYSTVATFIGKAYDRFDILLLGFLATPKVAGWYEASAKLTMPAMFIAGLVSSGLMAQVSDLMSRDQSVTEDVTNAIAFASSLAIPIFFGSLAISDLLVVTAYGPAYRQAAPLVAGLALYRVINTQTDVLNSILQGLDRPDVEVWVSLVALGTNIVVGVVLFERIGPLGVVIATVLAETVRYGYFYYATSKEVSASLLPRALFEEVAAGVVMFVSVEFVSRRVAVPSWQPVVVLVGFGGVVYFLVLAGISSHFRATVRGVFVQLLAEYDIR
jgi:O-antigen/teichoic acid export membrane protein